MEPYEPLRQLDESLWVVDGEWGGTPLKRRMTVMRVGHRELAIHSAIQLEEKDYRALDALGRVAWIIVPNLLHSSEAHHYAARYPDARVLAPSAAIVMLRMRMRVDGTFSRDWPGELAREITCLPFAGTRVQEAAFVHAPSRTLVLTDLVFNMEARAFRGPMAHLMKFNGVGDRFGPSRLFRYGFISNRQAFSRSLAALDELDYDRVIMSHGNVVESGGKRRMREAFVGY